MPLDIDSRVSPLSPYHPDNNIHHSGNGTYMYNPIVPKPVFSLGWELEANHSAERVPSGVSTIGDGSVNGDGTEYVLLPAVTKSPRFVMGLLKELVHSPKLNTDKSCGFHVHVGIQNASIKRLRAWAIATETLAKDIEDAAFKAVPDSRKGNNYCRRIKETQAGTSFQASKYNNYRRYHWLNTVEMFRPGGIRTIEIRLLGNTHRWKYLLSWVTFSMLLAREGWKVAHRPFESRVNSTRLLTDVLTAIEEDIKPLDKRSEPIPTWVYSNLKSLGIDFTMFDRPLQKIQSKEAELAGRLRKFYSDNQETRPNEDSDDDDGCACGCGYDGTCSDQLHSDGDCDSNSCVYCHDGGNCGGAPDCYACVGIRHEADEYCDGRRCRDCERNERGPWATPEPEEDETPAPVATVPDLNPVRIHNGNSPTGLPSAEPLTAASTRAAMESLRSIPIQQPTEFFGTGITEAINTMTRDTLLHGTHNPARITYDEERHNVRVDVQPLQVRAGYTDWVSYPVDAYDRAMCMLTMDESIMSNTRAAFYNGGTR